MTEHQATHFRNKALEFAKDDIRERSEKMSEQLDLEPLKTLWTAANEERYDIRASISSGLSAKRNFQGIAFEVVPDLIAEIEQLRAENARILSVCREAGITGGVDAEDAVRQLAQVAMINTSNCQKLEGALACSNATAKRRGAERDDAVAQAGVLREALTRVVAEGRHHYVAGASSLSAMIQRAEQVLAIEPPAALAMLKADAGRDRAVQELTAIAIKCDGLFAECERLQVGEEVRKVLHNIARVNRKRADEIAKEPA